MTEPRRPDQDDIDVRRVLAGDHGAFAGIVERWQHRLVNLAWRFCRDAEMAEDMAQEAFVRAFKALPTYRAEAAFSTWLTAVALNVYRSALRDRPPVTVDLSGTPLKAREASAHDDLEARERREAVRRMVSTLPPRYREPLVLFYFHDMNLAETARALAMPEGTLKARLHRGKEFLRRRLAAANVIRSRTDED